MVSDGAKIDEKITRQMDAKINLSKNFNTKLFSAIGVKKFCILVKRQFINMNYSPLLIGFKISTFETVPFNL